MIKFNGIGSAFNTSIGNNSAYILENETLVLIDCGCTVFHTIKRMDFLKNIKDVHVLITHTHPDHAGSLGDIIFYVYHILKGRVKVYFNDEEHLKRYFSCIGVVDEMYILNSESKCYIEEVNLSIEWMTSHHVNTLPSFSLLLCKNNETIYYSGDSGILPSEILERLRSGEISKIYQDTCSFDVEGNPHTSLNKLCNIVEPSLREKIYCMHLDEGLSVDEVEKNGFNVAKL
ncbi:MAG: MBL fold metallo-hydrolase [Clostridium sp.]